ncbi:MAG: hypothetical protein ACN6OP_04420 [Pseudomonadales bacterium]|uniref:hypothetical protein n=1 Tax=Cupriavidus sp. TaxID=1873897 RepID=UPI003D0FA65A
MAVRIIVGGVELPARPPRQRGPKFPGGFLWPRGSSAPDSLKSQPIAQIIAENPDDCGLQLVGSVDGGES